jgi:hypothetical protein
VSRLDYILMRLLFFGAWNGGAVPLSYKLRGGRGLRTTDGGG